MEVKHVYKAYDGKAVLADFSAVFADGTRHAIMAPSGRGKTTLLRLILGLEKPDRGEILGVPEAKSALFQEDRLIPGISIRKNLQMVLGKGVEMEPMLRSLGLWESREKPARELSGGMARRTALARALLAPGKLLVLDEPFNGLDEENRAFAAKAILEAAQGKTLLLVTHRPEDLELLEIAEVHTLPER